MAFTERELDIANQVKKQGGTKQDFLEILEQMRAKEPKQKTTETQEVTEVNEVQEIKAPKEEIVVTESKKIPEWPIDSRQNIQTTDKLTEIPDVLKGIKDVTGFSLPDDLAYWAEEFISKPLSSFAEWSKQAAEWFTTKATWEEWLKESAWKFLKNIIPSLWKQWAEFIDTIANPIDTTEWLINLGEWLAWKIVFPILDSSAGLFWKEIKTESAQTQLVDNIVKDIKDKYWTPTKFKKEFLENPALVLEIWFSALKKWWRLWDTSKKDLEKIDKLEKEAKGRVQQFLKPTKDKTTRLSEKVTPEILERGITWTRDELLLNAKEQVSIFGKDIEKLEKSIGIKGTIKRDQLLSILDKAADREALFTEKLSKKPWELTQWELDIIDGQQAKVKAIDALWDQLSWLWEEIPLEKMRTFRKAFDQVLRGTDASLDAFQNDLRVQLANEIRKEISKANTKLASLNKEYSFYKWLETVLEETQRRELGKFEWGWIETKRTGQITSLWTGLWAAVWATIAKWLWTDFTSWAAMGWFLWRQAAFKLDEVISSPKWKIASAQKKKKLADAIANWDAQKVEQILDSIIVAQSIKIDIDNKQEETETKEERKSRLLKLLRPNK